MIGRACVPMRSLLRGCFLGNQCVVNVVRLRKIPRGTKAFRPWGTSGLACSSAIVKLFGGRYAVTILYLLRWETLQFRSKGVVEMFRKQQELRQFQKKLPRKMEAAAKAEKLFLRQVHFTSLIILHFPPSSSTKQIIESLPSRSSSFQSPFCLRIVCSHRLSNQHIVFHLPVIVRSQNALEVRSSGKKIPEVGISCASLKRSYS